jgi:hypothetical protein
MENMPTSHCAHLLNPSKKRVIEKCIDSKKGWVFQHVAHKVSIIIIIINNNNNNNNNNNRDNKTFYWGICHRFLCPLWAKASK